MIKTDLQGCRLRLLGPTGIREVRNRPARVPGRSIGTDTETTMVPDMVGYSDSARGMRLRLRFDDRELVVEEFSGQSRP